MLTQKDTHTHTHAKIHVPVVSGAYHTLRWKTQHGTSVVDTEALNSSVYNNTKQLIQEHEVDAVLVALGSGQFSRVLQMPPRPRLCARSGAGSPSALLSYGFNTECMATHRLLRCAATPSGRAATRSAWQLRPLGRIATRTAWQLRPLGEGCHALRAATPP